MSKPETPQPPDYVGAANAQGDANIEAALAGTALATPNQVNPFGSTSWSNTSYDKAMQDWLAGRPGGGTGAGTGTYNPGGDPSRSSPGGWSDAFGADNNYIGVANPVGSFLAHETGAPGVDSAISGVKGDEAPGPSYTPSPEEQAYNQWLASRPDQSQFNRPGDWQLETKFSPELQALFDRTSNDPLAAANLGEGVVQNRDEAEEALYRRATRYLDPQTQQQREAFKAQLRDQGILPGSEAYTYQMDLFEKNVGTSYADARDRAITLGGTEADRSFNQNLQAWLQKARERQLPFEEYNQLRGLLPSANPSAQSVGASPILEALKQQFGADMTKYGVDASQYGSQLGAGAGIIGAILAALL